MYIWDLNGNFKTRKLWEKYYSDVSGVIYFIDLNDKYFLNIAIDELKILLKHEKLQSIPFLICMNKVDIY